MHSSVPFDENFPLELNPLVLSYVPATDLIQWKKSTPKSDSRTETTVQQNCAALTGTSTPESLLRDLQENILPGLLSPTELKIEEPIRMSIEEQYNQLLIANKEQLTNAIWNFDEKTMPFHFMQKCLMHFRQDVTDEKSQNRLITLLAINKGDQAIERIKLFIALEKSALPNWVIKAKDGFSYHLFVGLLIDNIDCIINKETAKQLLPFYLAYQKESKNQPSDRLPEWNRTELTAGPIQYGFYPTYRATSRYSRTNMGLEEALHIAANCCDIEIVQQLAKELNYLQCRVAFRKIVDCRDDINVRSITCYTQEEHVQLPAKRTFSDLGDKDFKKIFSHAYMPRIRSASEAIYLIDQIKSADPDYATKSRSFIKPYLENYWLTRINKATLNELVTIYFQGMNDAFINKPDAARREFYGHLFLSSSPYPKRKIWLIEKLQERVFVFLKTQPMDPALYKNLAETIFSDEHFIHGVKSIYREQFKKHEIELGHKKRM